MLTDAQLLAETGGYVMPSPLENIPGMRDALATLLSRVQALPFIPSGWTDKVNEAMSKGGIWQPRYVIQPNAWAQKKTSPVFEDMPKWLKDDANAAIAWNTLTDWWKAKMQPILAGWARDQTAVMNSANDDAAFWNGLYNIVKPVAMVGDAILAAPEAVAGAASKVITGTLGKLLPVILIGVVIAVAALVYKNKMTKG